MWNAGSGWQVDNQANKVSRYHPEPDTEPSGTGSPRAGRATWVRNRMSQPASDRLHPQYWGLCVSSKREKNRTLSCTECKGHVVFPEPRFSSLPHPRHSPLMPYGVSVTGGGRALLCSLYMAPSGLICPPSTVSPNLAYLQLSENP